MTKHHDDLYPTLNELDKDGAIRETAEAVDGETRAAFFRKAGLAGGGLVAGGALLGGLPSVAAAAKPSAKQDVKILNFALTLEFLEAAFYVEAISSGALSGRTLDFAKLVADHETAHVQFLQGALGSAAVKSPKFDFKGTNKNQVPFQGTSLTLENTGVRAYLGQAAKLTPKALQAAGSIVTIEARHAALIADIIGGDIKTTSPGGDRDSRSSMAAIQSEVDALGFIVG